mmetsp:Transcript_21877/g.45979  ORF Transcript_21877/g.45979 Transcript_21877/m.45979 type:complete len:140 (-) Transcript_21877:130-549(-)
MYSALTSLMVRSATGVDLPPSDDFGAVMLSSASLKRSAASPLRGATHTWTSRSFQSGGSETGVDEVDGGGSAGRDGGRGGRGVGCGTLSPLMRGRAGGGDGDDIGNKFGDASWIPESVLACEPVASGSENAAMMSMSMA